MKLFSNQSVRNKFIFITLIIIAISVTIGEITDYFIEKKRTVDSIVENTILDAQLISDYCVVPLTFDDRNAAHKTLEKLQSKPAIANAWLFNTQYELFASFGKNNTADFDIINKLAESDYAIMGDIVFVKKSIVYKNKLYGHLYVMANTKIGHINKLRIFYSLLLITGMLIIALILSSYFQRFITYPILKLTRFTHNFSINSNYSQRIKKIYDDEVGQLYDEFNHMLDVIEDANRKLANHKLHLEELVNKRTKALKETNLKLEKAKVEAEKANLIKSEFLSSMSHELRTPLNGILGYAQILRTMGKLESKQVEHVDIIHSSGKHLLSLINEILDYSKIEAKKLELAVADFNFSDLMRHVLNIIRIRAEQKDLMLVFEKKSELPDFVKGDEVKIRQVLINLLSNAVKYTKVGKVTLRVKFDESKKQNLLIEVEDTGIGIPQDQIDRVFEPFTQVDSQVKFIEGTGLGLAITRKLIELMDGKLSVTSTENKGSVFTVLLNLPIVQEVPKVSELNHSIVGYKGEKQRVLAVDDNLTNLSFLISMLEPLGFDVITAQNGNQAVEHYKTYNPDLVLMDLVMPEMNGIEAINKIRQLPKGEQIKIIGVTASVIERDERIKFITNCNGHIDKPVVIVELLDMIQQLLSIEWIEQDLFETEIKTKKKYKVEDSLIPDVETLNSIKEFAEMGDFSSIESVLNKLFSTDLNYYIFNKEVKGHIDKYDSDRLVSYIDSVKE